MNNEKLMAKIRRVGKISIAGIILYFVYVVAGAVHGAKNTFVDGFGKAGMIMILKQLMQRLRRLIYSES